MKIKETKDSKIFKPLVLKITLETEEEAMLLRSMASLDYTIPDEVRGNTEIGDSEVNKLSQMLRDIEKFLAKKGIETY